MFQHDGGLVAAMIAAWRDPRGSVGARLAARPRDADVLVWALAAALVGFIAGLPESLRQAASTGSRDLATGVLASRLFGAIFITPLFLFLLAGVAHLIASQCGGQGSYWASRVALVWATVVAIPLVLLNGFVAAFLPSDIVSLVSLVTLAGFGWIWAAFLCEVENFTKTSLVFSAIVAVPLMFIAVVMIFG